MTYKLQVIRKKLVIFKAVLSEKNYLFLKHHDVLNKLLWNTFNKSLVSFYANCTGKILNVFLSLLSNCSGGGIFKFNFNRSHIIALVNQAKDTLRHFLIPGARSSSLSFTANIFHHNASSDFRATLFTYITCAKLIFIMPQYTHMASPCSCITYHFLAHLIECVYGDFCGITKFYHFGFLTFFIYVFLMWTQE